MSERWRDTYDQWKLATPPEYEGEDDMPKQKSYSFDSMCMDLALHFLPDEVDRQSAHAKDLAQAIQDCVEGHMSAIEQRAADSAGESP